MPATRPGPVIDDVPRLNGACYVCRGLEASGEPEAPGAPNVIRRAYRPSNSRSSVSRSDRLRSRRPAERSFPVPA
jgi:hypothetical protein